MTTKRRVIIDTSVLISAALIEQGKPHATVFYVVEHETLLASSNTFHELETRLRRAKFLRRPYKKLVFDFDDVLQRG